jgi:hypothetical protein
LARSLLYGGVGKAGVREITFSDSKPMTASTFQFVSRAPQMPRRSSRDRRTRNRLRELCDEVLASYRLAQGQDVVTQEDREIAEQVLRGITPRSI